MMVAHWIRHQATKQFRAVKALHAERRWCLTGTPIQNGLEDIGSLIKFIRVTPFDSSTNFQRYIIEPLLAEIPDCGQNLRLLLGSICLRRTKRHLKISDPILDTVKLRLSAEEQALYSEILEKSRKTMDESVSSKSMIKRYNGMFAAIARLRMLCNHGTFYRSSTSSFTDAELVDLDKILAVLQVGNEVTCELCSCNIELAEAAKSMSLGSCCSCILCSECLAQYEHYYVQDKEWRKAQCIFCDHPEQSTTLCLASQSQSAESRCEL